MNAVLQFHKIAERYPDIKVVPYTHDYRDAAIDLARQIIDASAFKGVTLDEEVLERHLKIAGTSANPDRYLRLAVKEGRLLGGFYGCLQTVYFSRLMIAKDLGWFVYPEARGGPAAVLLLADFEQWARVKGAVKLIIGQAVGIDVDRTKKLYQHCGYSVVGYNTMKDI
jgi:GNAT superfamily N-acetyltransferase